MAASGTGGMSSTSAPASTARTAASPGANCEVTPPMSIASVTIRPWNFISSRSRPVRIFRESVAGTDGSGSNAGTARWPGMMELTPAAIAARKGTSSVASSSLRLPGTVASERCESTLTLPWPGKCFAVDKPPFSSTPRMNCVTYSETCCGSSPNERMLMMGLSGLLLTSASGAKIQCTPAARASSAVILPTV